MKLRVDFDDGDTALTPRVYKILFCRTGKNLADESYEESAILKVPLCVYGKPTQRIVEADTMGEATFIKRFIRCHVYRALYNTPIHYTHFILSADIHVMMYTHVMCYELCVCVYVLVPPCKTPINLFLFKPPLHARRCIDPWVHARHGVQVHHY